MNKINTIEQWIAVDICQDTCQDVSQLPNTLVQIMLGEGGDEGVEFNRAMTPAAARALADRLRDAADDAEAEEYR